jgi:glutamyl-tRNA synthetase
MTKCTWLNQQHLRDLSGSELLAHTKPWLEKDGIKITDDAFAIRSLESVKEKVSLAREFAPWVHYFFDDDFPIEAEVMAKLQTNAQAVTLLRVLRDGLQNAASWDDAGITTAISAVAETQKIKQGALMPLLRFSLSGQTRGPDVKVMMGILGKEKSIARIARLHATLTA